MSLINEALKKAQKKQAETDAAKEGKMLPPEIGVPASPPPPKPPPAAPPAASPEPDPEPSASSPSQPRLSFGGGKAVAGVAGVVGLAVVVWVFTRGDDSDAATEDSMVAVQRTPSVVIETETEPAPEPAATKAGQPVHPATETPAVVEARVPDAMKREEEAELPAGDTPDDVGRAEAEEVTTVAVEFAGEQQSITGRIAELKQERSTGPSGRIETVEVSMGSSVPSAVATPPVAVDTVPSREAAPTGISPPAAASSETSLRSRVEARLAATEAERRVTILEQATPTEVTTSRADNTAPDTAVLAYLESARVTGVRASSTDPKVLMNNRVYRLYDTVDQVLQLRVTKITPRELEFTDARGYVYKKSF